MELWDAYDEGLNKIDGSVLVRGEQIPNECFHLVCEIIVKHKDGSYLIMQRDKRKHLVAECGKLQQEDLHYKARILCRVPVGNFVKKRELSLII